MGLLAESLTTATNQVTGSIKTGGTYPGRGMCVVAHLRIGSILGVARGLFVSDVGDEAGEEAPDRAGVGVGGIGTGGSSGVVGALLTRELLLSGLVVELFFWHDSVGDACLGSHHEGEC